MSKTANHATSEKDGKIESKWFKDVFIVKAVMKFSTNNAAEEDWKEDPIIGIISASQRPQPSRHDDVI